MAALRLSIIAVGFFIVRFLRKITDFRVFDLVMFGAFFATITSILLINANRPSDYISYLLIDLAAVSAIYLAVPTKLANQAILGLFIMLGDIFVLLATKDASLHPQLYTIIPAFGFVNIVGFGLSRRLHASRCRECQALEAEQQAMAAKEKLETEQRRNEKLEAVGQLAGGVAHDFNNILTVILGNVSLARSIAASGSEMSGVLQEAETASFRARDLNRQLITFSKGGSPVKQPTYLSDLVRDTVKTSLSGSRMTTKITIPEVLMAELDPGQIGQVLKNLLNNSQEATAGRGTVWISAERIEQPEIARRGLSGILNGGNYIALTVADDGPGIPEPDRDKVFQPFFTTKPGASGLGLAVAYSIVKSHGGYITIESNGAKGAAFSIYLPAGITAPEVKTADTRPKRHYRVLVMDDEECVRKVAGKILVKLGYDVETAVDGREAIELYREAMRSGARFEVIILDLTVPDGMGGREAIEGLRAIDPSVNALISSGYSDDPAMSNFQELGFNGVVRKPYTMDQLGAALTQALGNPGNNAKNTVSK
jgi:signal transduction histidine kinase/ActR/RegA family two-component response regulator